MARTSTKKRAILAASLLQKTYAVEVALLRGDGRGRHTILACLVLVAARLEPLSYTQLKQPKTP